MPPLSRKDHPVMCDALLPCPSPFPLSLHPISLSMRRQCGNDVQARDGGLAWMDGDDDDGTGRSWSNDNRSTILIGLHIIVVLSRSEKRRHLDNNRDDDDGGDCPGH
jgi:hypothetical protein